MQNEIDHVSKEQEDLHRQKFHKNKLQMMLSFFKQHIEYEIQESRRKIIQENQPKLDLLEKEVKKRECEIYLKENL